MKRSMNGAAFLRFTPVVAALLLMAAEASAQDATVGAGASTAVRPAAAPVAVTNAGGDHDMWVGHVGVGWLGTRDVPVGFGAAVLPTLPAPTVGVRYWATPVVGIDVGVGFLMTSGSQTQQNMAGVSVTADDNSRTVFVLHGGIPLALAGSNHFSFQLTPEVDVGFGNGTNRNPPLANTDLSGFLLQVGARAGAEVYFGFIGIPQLSLDASVGVFLRSTSGKTTPPGGGSNKRSNFELATSSVAAPWDIFRKDIAARYYF
jgi:hypothetical protein